MKKNKKPYRTIEAENFRLLRLTHRLSHENVSQMLHVDQRTVMNWESGATRVPYTAYKLFKILLDHELAHKAWDGWRLVGDTLYSPNDRPFKPHELFYISHYFQMAHYWMHEYEKRGQKRVMNAIRDNTRLGSHLRLVFSRGAL